MKTIVNKSSLLKTVSPLVFSNGDEIFRRFMDEYVVHSKGFFILGSSGSGKTHYRQKN